MLQKHNGDGGGMKREGNSEEGKGKDFLGGSGGVENEVVVFGRKKWRG